MVIAPPSVPAPMPMVPALTSPVPVTVPILMKPVPALASMPSPVALFAVTPAVSMVTLPVFTLGVVETMPSTPTEPRVVALVTLTAPPRAMVMSEPGAPPA